MTSVDHADERAAAPQPQLRGHLVVAAAPGVQLGADVAGQLGHPPLDRRVDVLVARREHEDARGELLFDEVERLDERCVTSLSVRIPTLPSPLTWAREPDQIVGGQAPCRRAG